MTTTTDPLAEPDPQEETPPHITAIVREDTERDAAVPPWKWGNVERFDPPGVRIVEPRHGRGNVLRVEGYVPPAIQKAGA